MVISHPESSLLTTQPGTEDASKDVKPLLIKYARDPNSAPIFNYASMAFNNDFFFKGLSPNPAPISSALLKDLEPSFPSLETLRREFILTASAMFGPGFVWLVKDRSRNYHILTTYLAGSPWPQAHYRKQATDMNTEDEDMRRIQRGPAVNKPGAHGHASQVGPGGASIIPVLCLNTWEHVYLPDYGVGAGGIGGKKAFAEAWWETIDWGFVAENAQIVKDSTLLKK
jgi:Fe-Mn family superoxide dismutase